MSRWHLPFSYKWRTTKTTRQKKITEQTYLSWRGFTHSFAPVLLATYVDHARLTKEVTVVSTVTISHDSFFTLAEEVSSGWSSCSCDIRAAFITAEGAGQDRPGFSPWSSWERCSHRAHPPAHLSRELNQSRSRVARILLSHEFYYCVTSSHTSSLHSSNLRPLSKLIVVFIFQLQLMVGKKSSKST